MGSALLSVCALLTESFIDPDDTDRVPVTAVLVHGATRVEHWEARAALQETNAAGITLVVSSWGDADDLAAFASSLTGVQGAPLPFSNVLVVTQNESTAAVAQVCGLHTRARARIHLRTLVMTSEDHSMTIAHTYRWHCLTSPNVHDIVINPNFPRIRPRTQAWGFKPLRATGQLALPSGTCALPLSLHRGSLS